MMNQYDTCVNNELKGESYLPREAKVTYLGRRKLPTSGGESYLPRSHLEPIKTARNAVHQ